MRICIFGAGAVGGHIAARLAARGHEVSVLARGAHLAAMQSGGVRLLHGEEVIGGRVAGAERAEALGPQDAVIVALKANLLRTFAEQAAPLLKSDTTVVFAQNGIPWWYGMGLSESRRAKLPDLSRLDPDHALKNAIAPERIIGAVIYSANEVVEPGVIRNQVPNNNMLVLGEIDDRQTPRVRALRQVIEESGMSSPEARDIRQSVWGKLVQNLGTSTVCTVTGATVGGVRSDKRLAEILARIGAEGRAIAKGHGIEVEGAPSRPSGGQSSGLNSHKPSMLQDFERGRPMEIEAQLLAPLTFARSAGVATPTLDALIAVAAHKAAAKGLYSL